MNGCIPESRVMKKYLELIKINVKTQLIWRTDAFFSMISVCAKMLFAYLLWGIIFEGKETVAGFSYSMMISYYVLNSFFSSMDMSGSISYEMDDKIRNGSFSKYMIIPVLPQAYFLCQTIGKALFYVVFTFTASFIWIFIFKFDFVITANALHVVSVFTLLLLGYLFMQQFHYYLGLLTFKFKNIFLFLMIKDNIFSLISGAVIPLVLLPQEVISVFKYLPFYYISYLPTMLLLGRNSEEVPQALITMLVWVILFALLNPSTYKYYRTKFEGAGI